MSAQNEEQPMINSAFEDVLATASDTTGMRGHITAWVLIAVEEHARLFGRSATVQWLSDLSKWVASAQPARGWPQ